MHRLRELLAHGGIALLATVFALGTAFVYLANAVAQMLVSILSQHLSDVDFGGLALDVSGTQIYYETVLQSTIALLLVGASLFGLAHITTKTSRRCPECLSDIPERATVCRYCTIELTGRSE